jgi:hypothetical protein
MMASILREPLVYFLLLAGGFFLLFEQVSDEGFSSASTLEEIVVTEDQSKIMVAGFEKTWQRTPSTEELKGVIQAFVREEIFYREALAMGLDQNDAVVRRRLSQKFKFLAEDIASLVEPTEQQLESYLLSHADQYQLSPRLTFQQVYLNPNKRGLTTQTDAFALLEKLRGLDTKVVSEGDPLMIDGRFENKTDREIERVLGKVFLEAILDTPTGSWQGPINSGFGIHLVRIEEKVEAAMPNLNQIRQSVLRDWSSERREKANELLYENLRSHYKITIENDMKLNTDKLAMLETAQ